MIPVTTSRRGTIRIVRAEGNLTQDSVAAAGKALTDAAHSGQPRLIFDMTNISLIDSKALEMLLEVHELCAARGGRFKLMGVDPLCRDILALTRLSRCFEIHGDEASVLGSFAS